MPGLPGVCLSVQLCTLSPASKDKNHAVPQNSKGECCPLPFSGLNLRPIPLPSFQLSNFPRRDIKDAARGHRAQLTLPGKKLLEMCSDQSCLAPWLGASYVWCVTTQPQAALTHVPSGRRSQHLSTNVAWGPHALVTSRIGPKLKNHRASVDCGPPPNTLQLMFFLILSLGSVTRLPRTEPLVSLISWASCSGQCLICVSVDS